MKPVSGDFNCLLGHIINKCSRTNSIKSNAEVIRRLLAIEGPVVSTPYEAEEGSTER